MTYLRQFRAMKRRIDESLRMLIAEGARDGSVRGGDPALAAAAVAGAINWIPRWQDPDGALSPEAVARRLVDILMLGMLQPDERAQGFS